MSRKFKHAVLSLLLAPAALSAHHSFAEYDRSALHELEGELVEVRWRNPHVMFTLRAEDPRGGTHDWALETSAIYVLERAGLAENMFSVGQRVRIAAWESRRRPFSANVSNMLLPSGQEILFYPNSEPRWSSDSTGNRWLNEPVNREGRGIFRIWSVADLAAYLEAARSVDFQLTPSAEAKMTDLPPFDPCVPQGMPGTMLTPLPFEFIDRGDHIDLQLTTFGVQRRIDMRSGTATETIPLSDLGYSIGRWVGDTLEVQTTRVGWPYLDDEGRPQTENVEILESFSLVDDGNRLRYTQTVRDPVSLVEPMTVTWDLIDIGEPSIEPLRCE